MTLITLSDRFEQASKTYAEHNNIPRSPEWFTLKLAEELGELTQVWMKLTGQGRPKGLTPEELHLRLADETADLFGHVLLFARQNKLDLEAAIERKWRFRLDDVSNEAG